MSDPKWEIVTQAHDQELTERIKVQSGYIYRSIIWSRIDPGTEQSKVVVTQTMVFVPHYPIKVKTG